MLDILPTIYDETLQQSLIQSGIKRLLDYLDSTEWTLARIAASTEMEQGVVLGLLMHALEPFVAAFKHPGFSEEKEWRAVLNCQSGLSASSKKYRNTDMGKKSYLECIFIQGDSENLWQRKLLPISGIKNGPLTRVEYKNKLKELLKLNGYDGQVVFSDSNIPLRK